MNGIAKQDASVLTIILTDTDSRQIGVRDTSGRSEPGVGTVQLAERVVVQSVAVGRRRIKPWLSSS